VLPKQPLRFLTAVSYQVRLRAFISSFVVFSYFTNGAHFRVTNTDSTGSANAELHGLNFNKDSQKMSGCIKFLFLSFVLGLPALSGFATPTVGQNSVAKQPAVVSPAQVLNSPCADGKESGLPLPSTFLPNKLSDFQSQLKNFLTNGKYKELRWCEDKGLRDTGPYVNSTSYGVHPTVKIYYSPAIVNWLLRKNPDEVIPDGAMIVKEQYAAPAARYQMQGPALLRGWTIMIKDAQGAKDGWYWDESWAAQCVDNNKPPFAVPYGGFGLYCTRCHASAEKELTFSYTKNIKGFPGEYDSYFVDLSWASEPTPPPPPKPGPCNAADSDQLLPMGGHTQTSLTEQRELGVELQKEKAVLAKISSAADPQFVSFYKSIAPVPLDQVKKFPGETFDHIFAQNVQGQTGPAANANQFLTSDACMGCHSAGTYGNVMLYKGVAQPDGSVPKMNVSPFGEWRWSPMGLAGRDPIFYAQLESETAFMQDFFKNDKKKMAAAIKGVTNICFKCHGVMGKRRLDDDNGGTNRGDFKLDLVYATYDDPKPENPQAYIYGALARDGVSCMACHRIVEDKPTNNETDRLTSFLKYNITGNFTVGGLDQIFGPFKDEEIVTDPMNNSLGIKPKHDAYIRKSRMCGNCHTINLPLMDNPSLDPGKPHLEQLTYLEWLNSAYQDEIGNNPSARTCQDCHMETKYSNSTGTLKVPVIRQPIAFIEDDQYPQTGNRLPADKIRVRFRNEGFARHQLQGLNVSLLEIFRQYMKGFSSNGSSMLANDILGVRQNDYMSGEDDLSTAIDAFVEQAQNATATVALSPVTVSNQKLIADVLVTNNTGHRLPSGVGFRRAFVELKVVDNSNGQTVWCSGCTNELGVITDGGSAQSKRLPSELFDVYTDGSKPANHDYPTPCNNNYLPGVNPQYYQPHYYWDMEKGSGLAITRQDQVQIYEELNLNNNCALTTSFIRRDYQLKDNRLLPLGWTSTGPLKPDKTPYIPEAYLHETHPVKVEGDPAYANGSGTNVLRYEVPLNGLNPNNLTVTATLYYQSIPPYYLNDRFKEAPDGPATKRLYYLASNLQTKATAIENWKFKIAGSSQAVTVR